MLEGEDGFPPRDPCNLPVVDTGSQVTNLVQESHVSKQALGCALKDCCKQWHR